MPRATATFDWNSTNPRAAFGLEARALSTSRWHSAIGAVAQVSRTRSSAFLFGAFAMATFTTLSAWRNLRCSNSTWTICW